MEGEDDIDAEGDTDSENDDEGENLALLDTFGVSEGDPDPHDEIDTLVDFDGDAEKVDSRVALELDETLGVLVDERDEALVTLLLPDANLDTDSHEVTDMKDDGVALRSGEFEPESLLLATMVTLPAVDGDKVNSGDTEIRDEGLIAIDLVETADDEDDAVAQEVLLLTGLGVESDDVEGEPVEENVL